LVFLKMLPMQKVVSNFMCKCESLPFRRFRLVQGNIATFEIDKAGNTVIHVSRKACFENLQTKFFREFVDWYWGRHNTELIKQIRSSNFSCCKVRSFAGET